MFEPLPKSETLASLLRQAQDMPHEGTKENGEAIYRIVSHPF